MSEMSQIHKGNDLKVWYETAEAHRKKKSLKELKKPTIFGEIINSSKLLSAY